MNNDKKQPITPFSPKEIKFFSYFYIGFTLAIIYYVDWQFSRLMNNSLQKLKEKDTSLIITIIYFILASMGVVVLSIIWQKFLRLIKGQKERIEFSQQHIFRILCIVIVLGLVLFLIFLLISNTFSVGVRQFITSLIIFSFTFLVNFIEKFFQMKLKNKN